MSDPDKHSILVIRTRWDGTTERQVITPRERACLLPVPKLTEPDRWVSEEVRQLGYTLE